MKSKLRFTASILLSGLILVSCSSANEKPQKSKETSYFKESRSDGKTDFYVVYNPNNGATLSYSSEKIKLLEESDDGFTYAFKDMNFNGKLDQWEDWRLDAETRAKSLAKELTKEQIAGMMLFSSHERKAEDGLTDDQRDYLKNNHLRNILNASSNNLKANVLWQNEMQAYVETLGAAGTPVIPVNISTDPRSTAGSGDQYMVEGREVSLWPSNLGLAATFNPEYSFEFGKTISSEYRALGITTLLGPQIELATEPRWLRVNGTFGESTKLSTEMTEGLVSGLQSTYSQNGSDLGWGKDSINAMLKHFPGDGVGEGGREGHTKAGKYAIFPGDNFYEHVKPFVNGGLALRGKTGEAVSVMTSYSIALDKNGNSAIGVRKGSAFNKDKVDILRKDNNYNGIICTDWGITNGPDVEIAMPWGVESITKEERHYEILKSGIDMFGGNNDMKPVLAAYDMWDKDNTNNISAEERFQQSAKRLLKLFINPGLYENPFILPENSEKIAASPDKLEISYQAQLDSVVMVKNSKNTIKKADINKDYKNKIVYIPSSIDYGYDTPFGKAKKNTSHTMSVEVAKKYFKDVVTDIPIKNSVGEIIGFETPDLSNIDMAIIGMRSPNNGNNFSFAGLKNDSFYPLSLQYKPYTAVGNNVRKVSISGDILSNGKKQNRSYYGKTSNISNAYDLTAFENTIKAVEKAEEKTGKKIPVIVAAKASNPFIFNEFEDKSDAIVVGFLVSDNALFDIILGKQEPKGLLPMQFPKDMDTVEKQFEDVAFDMNPYMDSEGHVYDFAYGLDYHGVISDERTKKFSK